MSEVNIFRYRPRHMETDLFHAIAEDLRVEGEFAQGDEGLVLHNKHQVLAWSQPFSKFGGLLYYVDRERSLAEAGEELPDVEPIREYMTGFLERFRLVPTRGEYEVTIKLAARMTQAMMETGEKGELARLPMRVDVSSAILLDGLPVMGPRAKVRAAFNDGETPQFLHVGLWETVDHYRTGELIPEDRLREIIDERARRREGKIKMEMREITLAYWAREYQGGADLLEPYYFVEIEHPVLDLRKGEEGSGPRQVMPILAYTG